MKIGESRNFYAAVNAAGDVMLDTLSKTEQGAKVLATNPADAQLTQVDRLWQELTQQPGFEGLCIRPVKVTLEAAQ